MNAKSFVFFIIIISALISCTASKFKQTGAPEGKCGYIYNNNYSEITNSQQKYVNHKDTVSLNIVTFECTYSSSYISYSMYDMYGEWDDGVKPEDNKFRTYLIWENKDIFLDGNKYTIVTFGKERKFDISSSFMVLNEQGKDMLSEDSLVRQKFIDFFSEQIRTKKKKKVKTIFYQKYIKRFRPEYWKKYKTFPNLKIYIE